MKERQNFYIFHSIEIFFSEWLLNLIRLFTFAGRRVRYCSITNIALIQYVTKPRVRAHVRTPIRTRTLARTALFPTRRRCLPTAVHLYFEIDFKNIDLFAIIN